MDRVAKSTLRLHAPHDISEISRYSPNHHVLANGGLIRISEKSRKIH